MPECLYIAQLFYQGTGRHRRRRAQRHHCRGFRNVGQVTLGQAPPQPPPEELQCAHGCRDDGKHEDAEQNERDDADGARGPHDRAHAGRNAVKAALELAEEKNDSQPSTRDAGDHTEEKLERFTVQLVLSHYGSPGPKAPRRTSRDRCLPLSIVCGDSARRPVARQEQAACLCGFRRGHP